MSQINIDLETYSSVELKKAGLYRYVQSPDFQILLFGYSINGEVTRVIDLTQGEEIPEEIISLLFDPRVTNKAFNAAFEWYCLSKYFGIKNPNDWLSQWRCTMLHALYCGYPAKLEQVGSALGLPEDKRKKSTGTALINYFSKPCKPSKKNGGRNRNLPHHDPDKWELYKEYNYNDVEAEKEIDRRLSNYPVPGQEQMLWQLDQRINERGVAVDERMIEGALYCSSVVTEQLTSEAKQLTGLDNPNSTQQLTSWLEGQGVQVPNLQAETVDKMMEETTGPIKRVLEIRRELSKTSTKKYKAMQQAVCDDGRVRGLLQFYGANRTGRWAGRLVQVQNLPRNYLSTLEIARQLVMDRKVEALKLIYGNVPDTLSQLVRTAFIAPEGKVLLVADFSAIEARVIAWLAGEKWRLDVFNTHGKIYEASASQMFGVPIEQIDKGSDLRQKGKVAELALGYQGAKGALISMGALDQGLTEKELPEIVTRWRNANRRIVDLWYSLEGAAMEVMQTGQPVGVRGVLMQIESHYETGQNFFTITLPSGRKLYYSKPFLKENDFGKPALHYWGVDQEKKKWTVLNTYGGKLTENIVQAIARDCLAVSLVRLDQAEYETVMHVHDEAVIEADREEQLDHVLDLMSLSIPWAPGLPLKGDGFVTKFYMKD